jgi:hypothetical protein
LNITQERLQNLFNYDPETGKLVWKDGKRKQKKKNGIAGGFNEKGYCRIWVDGGLYYAHRLIWLYLYGEVPDGQIDHINHKKSDNRAENLRVVSRADNAKNTPLPKTNNSGVIGICYNKAAGKLQAQIQVNGKSIYLGLFDNLFDACCARKSAENKYGFHKNHGN